MASYELAFKRSVAKGMRTFPNKEVERLLERIRSLADEPRPAGCEKLSGLERYRVRQDDCRIVYEIQDQRLLVMVIKIGHTQRRV